MELVLTGKNLEVKPSVRQYVEKKLTSLDRHRHFSDILVLQVVLTEEKTKSADKRFIVEFTTNIRDTFLRAEERGPDLYQAIDRAADVMERQVERYKGKHYEKRRNVNNAKAGLATAPAQPSPAAEEEPSRVVKVKRHVIKPMTVDEAIEQMELLGHDFFLFMDCAAENLKVVYRRREGGYGVIEPVMG